MPFDKTCGPCSGNGYFGFDRADTCTICNGAGETALEGSPADYKACGPCSGNGYLAFDRKSICGVCKGIGLILRASLQTKRRGPDASFWGLLHPEIVRVAETRFDSKHLADAVEAALKEVNDRIKRIVKGATGTEYDGATLMRNAFSPNKPFLVLGDLSTLTGKDMQEGYMHIFAGSMIGIRNPKAHTNIVIDAQMRREPSTFCSWRVFLCSRWTRPRSAPKPCSRLLGRYREKGNSPVERRHGDRL